MHLPTGVFLLRMIDIVMEIALQDPIATSRVGVEPTACSHREVRRLLHRLHRKIAGCLDDDSTLAADPGDNGWPVFVIMAPPRLALLPASTCAAPQVLFAALLGLALLAGGVIE